MTKIMLSKLLMSEFIENILFIFYFSQ